jgi:hypothetical protein
MKLRSELEIAKKLFRFANFPFLRDKNIIPALFYHFNPAEHRLQLIFVPILPFSDHDHTAANL